MNYEGTIIRPPSEAHSIILQVTAGCSHNKCTFCGAYKDKSFRIRYESLAKDIEFAAQHCQRQKRVFLADGDALIIPYEHLHHIFQVIREKLPWVNRVSTYANGKAIRSKTVAQLASLKSLGLDRIYLGLESGCNSVLEHVRKGETAQSMIDAASKINAVGLFLSVTVLLGIAGKHLSHRHATDTAAALSAMKPNQISALTVIPLPGTPLYSDIQQGVAEGATPETILTELKSIVQGITLSNTQFYANHASNYLLLAGRLPKDRQKLLQQIDQALAGDIPLLAEHMRRL